MYLAQCAIKGQVHYFIRESVWDGNCFKSRQLLSLGTNPGDYIVYPGGNAYYIHQAVEDKLDSLGCPAKGDELEDLFCPFMKPRIRRLVESFRERAKAREKRLGLKPEEEHRLRTKTAEFDKRRIHYLRSGRMDQGRIGRMPLQMYKWLCGKSRDEIEQCFMRMECRLKASELKIYTYVIFNLQRFFTESFAKTIPQGLNQQEVEKYFLKGICSLNRDPSFWAGEEVGSSLHPYLIRYLIMFFDYEYGPDTFWRDYIRDFMNARRSWGPLQRKSTMTYKEASDIFGVTEVALKKMTKRGIVRLYRRMAQKLHPDKGGSHEKFIQLTEAYHDLLKKRVKTTVRFTRR
ncbi:MAG: J domain-containing protein [Thermodesulfobacteriota bacterium]|nr:J domain-containing protein [Thermodesulfobacteriota bacterium]